MASIRRRPGKRRMRWQAAVRLPLGGTYGTVSRTFDTRQEARDWELRTEYAIRRGLWEDPRPAAWVDEVIARTLGEGLSRS
ncbi:hypothetical protein AB0K16_52455 [Nonomuraea jabiensis]|uniref:hypothetical protein n=1 Tax=Nonomuraea jabiensis TaxID=882448 RepID=UPI00341C1740